MRTPSKTLKLLPAREFSRALEAAARHYRECYANRVDAPIPFQAARTLLFAAQKAAGVLEHEHLRLLEEHEFVRDYIEYAEET